MCRPDAASCDNNTRVQCNAQGTAISVLGACPAGERCAGGLCLPLSCDRPLAPACEGGAIVRCDLGALVVVDDCAGRDAVCVEDPSGAYCEPYACTPDAVRCSRDAATVEICEADGLGYQGLERCIAGEVCQGGVCAPLACAPEVAARATLLRGLCSATGDAEELAACEDGTYCNEEIVGAASCQPQICEPLSTRCDEDDNAVETCDTRGAYLSPLPCTDDTVCSAGACVERICAPGSGRCEGAERFVCDTLGATFAFAETCAFGCVRRGVPRLGVRGRHHRPARGRALRRCEPRHLRRVRGVRASARRALLLPDPHHERDPPRDRGARPHDRALAARWE